MLDPEGADVLGVNVPWGEFLNSGSFETTYMDAELRVSRSRVGIVDQLRVFVRSDPKSPAAVDTDADLKVQDDTVEDSQSTTTKDLFDSLAEAPSDVEPQPTTTTDYLDSLADVPSDEDVEPQPTTTDDYSDSLADAPSDVEPQPTTTDDYSDSLADAPSDVEVEDDTTEESSGDVDAPSDVE
jgi:hypothetical protein